MFAVSKTALYAKNTARSALVLFESPPPLGSAVSEATANDAAIPFAKTIILLFAVSKAALHAKTQSTKCVGFV